MAELEGLRGKRVLVIEDEYMIAMEIGRSLREMGAHVIGPAANAEDARQLLATEKVELAVLDLNLGGYRAVDLADAMSARQIPFVLATGYQGESIPARYAETPRCEKPFSMAALAKAISEALS